MNLKKVNSFYFILTGILLSLRNILYLCPLEFLKILKLCNFFNCNQKIKDFSANSTNAMLHIHLPALYS